MKLFVVLNILLSVVFAGIIIFNIEKRKINTLDIIEILLCFIPGGTIIIGLIYIYFKTKK